MTTDDDIFDLVIVGLGPVGGAAANLAGQHGLRTLAIDLAPEVHPLPRAIHFDADAMRVLQAAGVAPDVEAITRPSTGSMHLGMDGEPIRDFRVPDAHGDLGWSPHYLFFQPELDGLLRRRAAQRPDVDVRLGWKCDEVEEDPDGVTVHMSDVDGRRRTDRGRYVLGCDGASSTTRQQLGIQLFDYEFEESWIVIDLTVPSADLGPGHIVMFCDPCRPATYVPGPGRHRRWEFMVLPGEDGDRLRAPESVHRLIQGVAPWLDLAEAEFVRSAEFRFHGLVATEWSRVASSSPGTPRTRPRRSTDRACATACATCAICCGSWGWSPPGPPIPTILSSYQAEREPHVRTIMQAAITNGRYICTLDPAIAAQRDAEYRELLRAGADVGSFRNVIPPLTAGLLDPGSTGAAPVGSPFPQPRAHDAAGQAVLFDDLLGAGFAAVTCEAAGLDEMGETLRWFVEDLGARVLPAEEGLLGDWFVQHRCRWALVRPDRYVFGVAADAEGFVRLVASLRSMLVGGLPLVRHDQRSTSSAGGALR